MKLIDQWQVSDGIKVSNNVYLFEYLNEILYLIQTGHYSKAQENLLSNYPKCESILSKNEKCAILSLLLAIVNRKLGDFKEALKYAEHAETHLQISDDNLNYCRCKIAIGDIWRSKDKRTTILSNKKAGLLKANLYYNEAEHIINEFHEIQSKNPTSRLLQAQVIWAQAKIQQEKEEYSNNILKKLYTAWEISENTESKWAQEECAQIIGRYFEFVGDYTEAVHWYQKAYLTSQETHNLDRYIENSISLAKLHLKMGRKSEAVEIAIQARRVICPFIESSKLSNNHQFYDFLDILNEIIIQVENQ